MCASEQHYAYGYDELNRMSEARRYLLERVDEAAIVQYYADGFEALPLREKLRLMKGIVLPLFIVVAVMGSIYAGFASVTESAALGVLGTSAGCGIRGHAKCAGPPRWTSGSDSERHDAAVWP